MNRAALLLPLLLASCGDLPQPFLGRPGALGARLAQPPPARLAVPAPPNSLLGDGASAAWANATAAALQADAIPAVAGPAQPGDWVLSLSAAVRGDAVVPTYAIANPRGAPQGASEGPPVPLASWAISDPTMLRTAAASAEPGISALLDRIQTAVLRSDPHSLLRRPARVRLTGITGAPGDGNASLARQIRRKLADLGVVVQDAAKGADYQVSAEVHAAPNQDGTERVELQWIVRDPAGNERGRIVQLNDVAPNSVAPYWGDTAAAAAAQAAGGIKDVVLRQSGVPQSAIPPSPPAPGMTDAPPDARAHPATQPGAQ